MYIFNYFYIYIINFIFFNIKKILVYNIKTMPKSLKNQYTQKQFEKDLNELELLVKQQKIKGGKPGKKEEKEEEEEEKEEESVLVGGDGDGDDDGDDDDDDDGDDDEEEDDDDDDDDYDKDRVKEGGARRGKKEYDGPYRHFKFVEVDGKPYTSTARANITNYQTPLNAAKKLLSSMIKQEKLSDNAKSKLKIVFYIKEINRESKNKKYGPYIGTYYKYTPSEAAKAKTLGGKVSFKFKPIVKLYKGNKKEQKGGKNM